MESVTAFRLTFASLNCDSNNLRWRDDVVVTSWPDSLSTYCIWVGLARAVVNSLTVYLRSSLVSINLVRLESIIATCLSKNSDCVAVSW